MTFLEKIHSHYSSNVSFRCFDQGHILTSALDDHDRMHEVEDSLLENSLYRIFPENPLHFGFFLDTITTGKLCYSIYSNCYKQSLDEGQSLSFIETSDCISDQVAYKIPEQGEVEAVRFETCNDCIIL